MVEPHTAQLPLRNLFDLNTWPLVKAGTLQPDDSVAERLNAGAAVHVFIVRTIVSQYKATI